MSLICATPVDIQPTLDTVCTQNMNRAAFPLPLSPMEICWVLEDCPSHPIHFFLRFHLSGHLERAEFEAALQQAVVRHPLFTAIVEQRAKNSWQWVAGPEKPIPVTWTTNQTEAAVKLPEAKPIDIFTEQGLRISVTERKSDSVVCLQIHHSVCDAIGACDFAADLFSAYTEKLSPDTDVNYKNLDPKDLHI